MRAAKAILRILAGVVLTLALFVLCGWVVVVGWMAVLRMTEDPDYAQEFFEPHLAIEDVLETRKWHVRGGDWWDCTYAIVRLTDDIPRDPPSWRGGDLGWQYRFGGDWQQTPVQPLGSSTRDAFGFCAQYWSVELVHEMREMMANGGSWYSRGLVGETLYLYSVPNRLAVRIRFGD